MNNYCDDLFNFNRRNSRRVNVGNTPLGVNLPVRLQSMTNTNTLDTEKSVEQIIKIADAGGEYVRLTAQGVREAENLNNIHDRLSERGYHTPLVADIHFNPKAAEVAALYVEKVRINPGNFAQGDVADVENKLVALLNICKEKGTALRVGVNHGSLSRRMMDEYGDTPRGMAESAMEYLRLCRKHDFNDVVVSMKASNTVVMVQSVRLLCKMMNEEGMDYPLHLGVTEAGNGEDGRIKSAVGIGALLADGIGDTIRVSLSEDPEDEIPVAKTLAEYFVEREYSEHIDGEVYKGFDPYSFNRRMSARVSNIGGGAVPVVVSAADVSSSSELKPDYVGIDGMKKAGINAVKTDYATAFGDWQSFATAVAAENTVVVLAAEGENRVGEYRAVIHRMMTDNLTAPVVLCGVYDEDDPETLQLKAAADMGVMFIDGLADGIMIANKSEAISADKLCDLAFTILQCSRARTTKTEYISCPSCGRTLYNLQETIAKIKAATASLKGLKIGIMGCIVNGPGEMADADYGYVGAGVGKVSLYKRKECVEKNIPEDEAVDKLVELIKQNGDWK